MSNFKKYSRSFIAVSLLLTAGISAALHCDWSTIDVSDLHFPHRFAHRKGLFWADPAHNVLQF